jgi:hypothetical protein
MHAILNKALTNKSAYRALVPCAVALILLNLVGLYIARPVPGRIGIGYGGALSQFIALTCVQGAGQPRLCFSLLGSPLSCA